MRPADRTPLLAGGRLPLDIVVRAIVSLVLAVALWGWVTTQRDPIATRPFNDLAIVAPQLSENLDIAGEDLGSVSVRLEGPRSAIDSILPSELEPQLDVSEVNGPGTYTVPIRLPVPPAVQVDRLTPDSLSIVVDENVIRTIPLDYTTRPSEDGTRRVDNVVAESSEVTVSGPRRLVDRVARTLLEIEIGDRTEDFEAQFPVIARDANGEVIQDVEIRPRRVDAQVNIQTRGRSVPVLVQTVGNPAPGFEVVDSVANPPTVVLDGPEATLDELVSVVTEPVDVEGATLPVNERVGLEDLPTDVSVVDPVDDAVTAVVQVRQRGITQTLPDVPIEVVDLAAGLSARSLPESLSLVVYASEEVLGTLRVSDVAVQVSAEGLDPGTHRVEPRVVVPADVQWIRIEPELVDVVVTNGTATPTADASAEGGTVNALESSPLAPPQRPPALTPVPTPG